MPYGNVTAFQRYQAKIEAVRGTAETVMTRWLYLDAGSGFSWTYTRDREDAPETLRSFHVDRDTALTNEGVTFSLENQASYEDLPWYLRMILKGGTSMGAGTTTGSTPPGYTYTFTPSTGVDDLDTFTAKVGDGSLLYRLRRCVLGDATFRCNPNDGGEATWRMAANGIAIFDNTTSIDAPSDISRTKILSNGSKVYLDTTLTLGTTQLLGKVRNMSFTITNNPEEKRFVESGATAAADFARGYQRVTGDITVEAVDDTQFAQMRANTPLKLRFESTGASIGSSPTTNYLFQADFPQARLNAPSRSTIGNNYVWTFPFIAEAPASGVPITVKIVNALATVTA